MDLERTLLSNVPCFWLGNKHGYTYKIKEAGIFPKHLAEEIVKHDFDKTTVMISTELIEKTMLLDLGNVNERL